MFNRKIELKLVKDTKPQTDAEARADTINRINSKESLLELGKFVVIGTIIVIAASAAITTASALIVDAVTNPKD